MNYYQGWTPPSAQSKGKPHLTKKEIFAAVKEFKRPRSESFTVSGVQDFPDVIIEAEAHGKMMALIQTCDIEIGWMSSVTRCEVTGDFHINDVYVPLQECSAATTDITAEGDAALMMELIEAGKMDEINALRCWGHSHVDMGVSPSNTDETQTEEFCGRFTDHFIRVIGNKYGDLMCHVYLIGQGITLNNPDLVVKTNDVDYTDWAKEQIKTKVTQQVWTTKTVGGKTQRGYVQSAYTGDNSIYDDRMHGGGMEYLGYDPLGETDYDPMKPLDDYAEFDTTPDVPDELADDPYYDFTTRGR